ncbi:MAG: hypothetical protein NTV34_20580, partial [Proteobacteria bacterium]|nr:hypothetical protein [Pseudomonadota bacterium]
MSVGQTFERVVQLELNEISHSAIQKLIGKGKLSNFKLISESWTRFDSTSETIYEHIEPWIQWITAHTGKTYREHNIFRLGDAHELKHDQIWEVLSDQGIESAVIGAMNATRGRTKGGVFFPDPWSKENTAYPAELRGLWRIISGRVQSHAATQPGVKDLIQTFVASRAYKVSPLLGARIVKQIITQKLDARQKWRLAGLFDLFLADIFVHLLGQKNLKFCSLFLNSVANYQHHFWRNFEPELFAHDITSPDCNASDDPMTFGYEIMDEVLGRVLRSVNLDKTLVIVASGLSQVPDTRHEAVGGMNYYRLQDHRNFAELIGLSPDDVFPLMSRDWQIRVQSDDQGEQVSRTIKELTVEGKPVFHLTRNTHGFLFVETAVTHSVNHNAEVLRGKSPIGKFVNLFANIAVKSAHHSGLGSIWMNHRP